MNSETIEHQLKEADVNYPIQQILKDRWSPRVFTEVELKEKELRQLFEAVRWAASSYNQQPWRFIVGRKGSDTYQKIFDLMSDFNQGWVDSPVLILCAFKKTFDNGKDNFHALHDLGLGVGNMSLQAQSMGIALHQMAGVDRDEAKKAFGIPDDYHVATAIAVGFYGGDPSKLSDDLQEQEMKERTRMPQTDFVFNGEWGKSF